MKPEAKKGNPFSSKAVAKKKRLPMHAGVSAGTTPAKRGKPFKTPNSLVSFTLR